MIGAIRPASAAFTRPAAAAAAPAAQPPAESVELSQKTPEPVGLKGALKTAQETCRRVIFGPVAHGLGRAFAAVGFKPKEFDPPVPPSQLTDLPDARIERPLLCVHGWHGEMKFFGPLLDKLAEGGNPGAYVQNGRFFRDEECQHEIQPGPETRAFVTVFSSFKWCPDSAMPEMRANINAIQDLTGQAVVDLAGFSMGGLCSRLYLDEHEDPAIGKLLMIGTPNQGVGMAAVTNWGLDGQDEGYDLRWLLDIKGVDADDREALEWLRPGSQPRAELNKNWPRQKARVEDALAIGAADRLTVGNSLQPTRGDALVPFSSLGVDDLPVKCLSSKGPYSRHGALMTHPETYLTMKDFFGWRDLSESTGG